MNGFKLNSALDVTSLARDYEKPQRLQIYNVLADESAAALYQCLSTEVPWAFAWFDDGPKYRRSEEMRAMSMEDQQALRERLVAVALEGFHYAYNCYPILDAYLQKWNQVPLLDKFIEFINSEEMLGFMRDVSGIPEIIKGDAQATRYGPNQYLKFHTDGVVEEARRMAYVLNLTPEWDNDWGGYLQFYDGDGNITQAFKPRYNVLNIFTVPQDHSVSYVASYAARQRYAITGWFRDS